MNKIVIVYIVQLQNQQQDYPEKWKLSNLFYHIITHQT